MHCLYISHYWSQSIYRFPGLIAYFNKNFSIISMSNFHSNQNYRNGIPQVLSNDLGAVNTVYPISMLVPSEEELALNDEMESYLFANNDSQGYNVGFNLFETSNGEKRRSAVIEKLNQIAIEWALELTTNRNIDFHTNLDNSNQSRNPNEESELEYHAKTAGGVQIKIFGSYRLGVHNSDSDIDALLITPMYISRNDFFSSFCDKLRSRIGMDIESVTSIPEAYTPVVKFTIDSQAVDMIFVSIQYRALYRDLDVLDLRWLRGLDDQSVRSLNGSRVAEWICKLVPNMKSFSTTLRIVKLWARKRGIYSNVLGFLGGVNYALLVGFTCQLCQYACPLTLLRMFFRVFSHWHWPQPIMMRDCEDMEFKNSDGRYLQVWNPKTVYKDSLHLMPIITPAYPCMNSAYNVSQPQYRYIMRELTRGFTIAETHFMNPDVMIDKLFESPMVEFFHRFPKYIQIDISANNESDQRSWFGWVESRIRLFIISLEQPPIMHCHPIANCFHRQIPMPSAVPHPIEVIDHSSSSVSNSIPVGIVHHSPPSLMNPNASHVSPPSPINARLKPQATDTPHNLFYVSSFFIGLSFQEGLHLFDASFCIQEFMKKANSWNLKKPEMSLSIHALDRSSIPPFVFDTRAEPSNIKSCTPKAKITRPPLDPSNTLSPVRIQLSQVPEKKVKIAKSKIKKGELNNNAVVKVGEEEAVNVTTNASVKDQLAVVSVVKSSI